MFNLKTLQLIGILLCILGITGYVVYQEWIPDFLLGVLTAFGIALVIGWVPFKTKKKS